MPGGTPGTSFNFEFFEGSVKDSKGQRHVEGLQFMNIISSTIADCFVKQHNALTTETKTTTIIITIIIPISLTAHNTTTDKSNQHYRIQSTAGETEGTGFT